MMTLLWIITVLWGMRIAANCISFTHLWFVKEYRLDRMLIHLKTKQGKRIYFLPFRRPPVSPKSITVMAGSIAVLSILFFVLPWNVIGKLLFLDILSFPVTMILVLLTRIPTLLYHSIRKNQAAHMLAGHSEMITIGITGSYGKTSTKEYLADILGTKYRVLKTEASKNSAIGIAETVIRNLQSDHEIFIVEMGAYKKGEITEMVRMVNPRIGILTAVNAQHQDLFGTIEQTMNAKYELIEGLKGSKIAVINADNPYTKEMAGRAVKDGLHVWSFSTKTGLIPHEERSFRAEHIEGSLTGVSFEINSGKERVKVRAPVLGLHQAYAITAGVAGAVAAGMTLGEAASAAGQIRPLPKTMEPLDGINGSIFINDTFNNNPDAAIAAIEFLSLTKGKKYLVFQPMIELGSYASSSHERVAKIAGKICDGIILTNNNFYEYFMKGMKDKDKVHVYDPDRAATYLRSSVQKGDTVLFKGKESENVLRKLV